MSAPYLIETYCSYVRVVMCHVRWENAVTFEFELQQLIILGRSETCLYIYVPVVQS